jgi:uroporphyrin-III C-methyltransferase / precorrin-2 dehydrogenase / sirohydrochlorin ferrochelatase
MSAGYPLLLDLAGRRVVVVGGGRVALRRARGLLEADAVVHVVAPDVLPELAALDVVVHRRRYAAADLAGAWLVHACTDDPAVNAAVAAEAERRHVFCVRADASPSAAAPTHVPLGAALTGSGDPPAHDRGRAAPGAPDTGAGPMIEPPAPDRASAASDGGHAPGRLSTARAGSGDGSTIGPVAPDAASTSTHPAAAGWGDTDRAPAAAGAATAPDGAGAVPLAGARGTAWTPAVARDGEITVAVNAGGDPARAAALRDGIARLLAVGDLPRRRRRPAGPGRVALVGGGPGDPELITVRGRRLLAEADVVVVDRLAPQALLDPLAPDVEVVDVGKAPHGRGSSQDEINAMLVDRARAGKRVVRLKGGDPFVFGRGGEEVLACVAAGVPVEVVPGVTSALAGPAAAGIPVTHRGVASDFAVVSGHLDPAKPGSTVDWQALADGPATLVLLMAVDRLEAIATELVKRGRPAATPVAVIRNATRADQQVLVGTLETIAGEVASAGLRPPAAVVIGEVVRLRDRLWGGAPPPV